MADIIQHGSQQIVGDNSVIDSTALPNTGVTAASHTSNNTQLVSFTVDAKGRITAASNSSINVTGVTFASANSTGGGTFEHSPNQKIYISTSAPANNSIGNNGDIWYQTLT